MPFLELALVGLLILINGVLSMSELAIVSARRARLQSLAEQGVNGARRAMRLAADPGRFLSTVQIGITLVGILAGAFSGAALGGRLSGALIEFGMPARIAEPLGFGIVVALITYFSLVIGELVPKQLALRNAERIACLVAPAMIWLALVASPVVWLLDRSGRLLLALFGRRGEDQGRVTDEEIKMLIAEAESAGVIEPEERRMISGVMQLGDRPVRAVMTPRPDVDMVNLSESAAAIRRTIVDSNHSRLPAHDGNPDEVLGVIQAKDMLDAYLKGRKPDARKFLRQAPAIPDSMDSLEVIEKLKNAEVHMGLVLDEYGHFEGVVTSADILEAIAGVFRTEEGAPDPHAVQRSDGSFLLSGAMPVEELESELAIKAPGERSYHTLAGYVLDRLGHIPALGESFDDQGWRFEVIDLDGRRIDKVLAARLTATMRKARPL
jgi:putative hemolysin